MLKEGMTNTWKKKKEKNLFKKIPDFLLFVVAATFILPPTSLLRLDATG